VINTAQIITVELNFKKVSLIQPREYLNKLPAKFEATDRILVSDPMLATGGTMMAVLEDIMRRGGKPDMVRVLAITVAPPALKLLSEKFPGVMSPFLYCFQSMLVTCKILLRSGFCLIPSPYWCSGIGTLRILYLSHAKSSWSPIVGLPGVQWALFLLPTNSQAIHRWQLWLEVPYPSSILLQKDVSFLVISIVYGV
jgi:hypothetical protein